LPVFIFVKALTSSNIMATKILTELTTAKDDFLKTLALFAQDNFNTVPFEGSWTAGQVAQHIFKSIDGVPDLIIGGSKPTERDPVQNVPGLRQMFLDFETKMKSPDFILPDDSPKDLQQLAQALKERFNAIIKNSAGADLTLTFTEFEFPGMGEVTRLELLNFISVHTQRHTHQLKEIQKHLK